MRILETLFLTLTVFSFLNLLLFKKQKLGLYLPIAGSITAVFSILIEGFRTHIIPVLLLSLIFLAVGLFKTFLPLKKPNRVIQWIAVILLIPIFVISIAFPLLFSVPLLPKPTGSYSVGTMFLSFQDSSRKEQFSTSDEYRNVPVQVWYPSSNISGKKSVNWISRKAIQLFAASKKLPNLFDHLALVKTHSYLDANISDKEKTYPVLLFSGGGEMFNGQNVVQMEELASHGYIVFSVGHPYEDFACIYPDGTITPYSEKPSAALSADTANAIKITRQTVSDESSPEFYRTLVRNAKVSNDSARIWSRDMAFVADKITEMNAGKIRSIFMGKLDLSKLGAFGHSFGGAAAGQLCLEDNRVKAFINMDGTPFGDAADCEIQQPFMILTNQGNGKNNIHYGYSENEKNFMMVRIQGSEHMNFSDFNSLLPTVGKLLGALGDIEENRQTEIMNDYILSFFDKYIKNKPAPLLDAPSSIYPEVTASIQ